MAKVLNNLLLQGLSGMIGRQIVLRRRGDQTVVAAAPRRVEGREPTPGQKAYRARFREAAAYAKAAQGRPEYQAAAKVRGIPAYNVALADFLHPPIIERVDVSSYTGKPGQTITILATDDLDVASVEVRITSGTDVELERGRALRHEGKSSAFTYTTASLAPSGPLTIVVVATDMAGQSAQAHVSWGGPSDPPARRPRKSPNLEGQPAAKRRRRRRA